MNTYMFFFENVLVNCFYCSLIVSLPCDLHVFSELHIYAAHLLVSSRFSHFGLDMYVLVRN